MSKPHGSAPEMLDAARLAFGPGEAAAAVPPPEEPPPEEPAAELTAAEMTEEEAAYMARFRRSLKGNLVLKGWLTDTRADGQPAAPFQLVIFPDKGEFAKPGRWVWAVAVDQSPIPEASAEPMEYGNGTYPTVRSAALAARAQLAAGGLTMSDDAPVLVGLRIKIQESVARRRRRLGG